LEKESDDARHVRVRAFAPGGGPRDLVLDVQVKADPGSPPRWCIGMRAGRISRAADGRAGESRLFRDQRQGRDAGEFDRSGSMSGAPMDQACAAAVLVLQRLRKSIGST